MRPPGESAGGGWVNIIYGCLNIVDGSPRVHSDVANQGTAKHWRNSTIGGGRVTEAERESGNHALNSAGRLLCSQVSHPV